jgi:hypothetical protein
MLAESKLILPPLLAVGVVVGNIVQSLPETARVILDLAALGILFAGFLILGKLRAQVSAAEGAANAWKEERDALSAKAERLLTECQNHLHENSELRVQIATLEARPTLESLEAEVRKLATLVQSAVTAVAPVPQSEERR